jgi:hypothetical protein
MYIVGFVELGLPPEHAITCADSDNPDTLRSVLQADFTLDDVLTLLDEGGKLNGALRVRPAVNETTPPDVRVLAAHLAGNTATRPSLCVTAAREAIGTAWAQTLRTFVAEGMPLADAVDAARALDKPEQPTREPHAETAGRRPVRVTPTTDSPAQARATR